MVWIYGGAYFFGTGESYPGYGLAVHGDVVVVNFNYRVSTLGWLSTGEHGKICTFSMILIVLVKVIDLLTCRMWT